MSDNTVIQTQPLWLMIEEKILGLSDQDLADSNRDSTLNKLAGELDQNGINVSLSGGNFLALQWAIEARASVGHPLMKDFNEAVAALKLEDVEDPYKAAMNLICEVGESWPALLGSERRPDVINIIENTRLTLLTDHAKGLSANEGIRYLIGQELSPEIIIERLSISQPDFDKVNAAVEAEKAEVERVKSLIEAVSDKGDDEKIKHLITNNVADALITELAGSEQSAIDNVKKAMEEEIAEKKKLEEEAAAKKAAEAAGPSLESISADDMLEHIEGLREILDFSDKENEIRSMSEQSSIPKCLVDVAVSDPDKLDELEEKAESES